jgi:hypothetical protein
MGRHRLSAASEVQQGHELGFMLIIGHQAAQRRILEFSWMEVDLG